MRSALFLACVALPLAAAAPSARSAEISLSDCLSLAGQKSIPAVQSELDERQADAARTQAAAALRPQLFASGQLLRSDDASTNLPDDNNGTVAVEQKLLPFGPAWERAKRQNALYAAAVLARVETQADVALAVKRLYFAILEDEDARKSSDEIESELRRLLETVVPKFTVGRAPAFDPVKVRVALSDLSRARGLLEARLTEERETLALVVGLKDGSELALKPVTALPGLPPPGFSDLALASDPTLRALAKKVEAARFGASAAEALRYPDLVGHLDYNYAAQATSQMTAGWTASVAMRVPLFDWGGISSQVETEKLNVRKAQADLEGARQAALESATRALAQAQARAKDLANLRELLPRVHEVALAGVRRYRLGATSILEATDGVNLWLGTLLNERAAYYDYLTSLAELERLSGGGFKADYAK